MGSQPAAVVVRVADAGDVPALCLLRSLWSASAQDRSFEQRMASWLASEGDRRTTWLAELADSPVGMGSLFEYRRMPRPGRGDSCWGYVANVFVREELRNRGIGSALLAAITSAADGRGYARLVLSPNPHALPVFYRAGFTDPAHTAGDHLLVRPRPAR